MAHGTSVCNKTCHKVIRVELYCFQTCIPELEPSVQQTVAVSATVHDYHDRFLHTVTIKACQAAAAVVSNSSNPLPAWGSQCVDRCHPVTSSKVTHAVEQHACRHSLDVENSNLTNF